MAFIPVKCTQCGASLSVDDSKDSAVCEYCKTPFVLEKKHTSVHADTVHLNAHTIQVLQDKEDDFEIIAGSLRSYKGSQIDVVVPEGVVEIDPGVFSGMTALRSVTLPSSLKQIEGPRLDLDGAFAGCTSLEIINLPEGIEIIEEGAFRNCKNLSQINIPDGVAIHTYAFGNSYQYGCPKLTKVEISDKKLLETTPNIFLYTGYKSEAYQRFNKLHNDAYKIKPPDMTLPHVDQTHFSDRESNFRNTLIIALAAVVILIVLLSGSIQNRTHVVESTPVEKLYQEHEESISVNVSPSGNVSLVDDIIMVYKVQNNWGFVSAVLDDLNIDLGANSDELKQRVIENGGELSVQANYSGATLEVFLMYDSYSEVLSMSIVEIET